MQGKQPFWDSYFRQTDLNNCDKEPIHSIGYIQDHGTLISCDIQSKLIVRCSENCHLLFGKGPLGLLGKPITRVIDAQIIAEVYNELESSDSMFCEYMEGNERWLLIGHQSGNELVLEFESYDAKVSLLEYQSRLAGMLKSLEQSKSVEKICDKAAHLVKKYTGYDRVMVYRFDEDWNGNVIAEQKKEGLEPWLGLHFPASDIPRQARKLFQLNGARLVRDVNSRPVHLVSLDSETLIGPLDQSLSELRSVSPIHIEYLTNMKVRSTFTIAVLCEGRLWGLIACHHYTDRFINYYHRMSFKFLAQAFAVRVQLLEANLQLKKAKQSSLIRSELMKQVIESQDLLKGLSKSEYTISDLTDCKGAAVCYNGDISTMGDCPDKAEIRVLLRVISSMSEGAEYHTTHFVKDCQETRDYKKAVSGVLCLFISKANSEALIWFKPEVTQAIRWAGKPEKLGDGMRLSPRKSFSKWVEIKKGYAEPWGNNELSAARSLQKDILNLVAQKYEEAKRLNKKLKKAYANLESFSYSLSHDLQAPLRGIDGFAQIIKEEYYSILDDLGKSSIQTIISSVEKMNVLIDDMLKYSGISHRPLQIIQFSLQEAVLELLPLLETSYPNVTLRMSETPILMRGDRSIILLLLKNLLENAFKYSAKKAASMVTVGEERGSVYFVKDNGIGFDASYQKKIFSPFQRLVNEGEYPGTGIGLAIAKRVIDQHGGKIWAESTMGMGSTFYFELGDGLC